MELKAENFFIAQVAYGERWETFASSDQSFHAIRLARDRAKEKLERTRVVKADGASVLITFGPDGMTTQSITDEMRIR